jgi:hypothetical protein
MFYEQFGARKAVSCPHQARSVHKALVQRVHEHAPHWWSALETALQREKDGTLQFGVLQQV